MDNSLIANLSTVLLSEAFDSGSNYSINSSGAINIPGTIVGTLGNVVNTKSYMEQFQRYNNYLTNKMGAAQMAADRYMSLKERVPMSFEYYETPQSKKEVVMYLNPETMSLSTQKVKQKVFTRGGIYFHHYGDDVWMLSMKGTVGYAQMKGIEALAEVYHNSGALLKYQNITESTVHTNQITTLDDSSSLNVESISSLLGDLAGSSSSISKYLGKVIGTATDAIGITGNGSNSLVAKLTGDKASASHNANLFSAITSGFSNVMKTSGIINNFSNLSSAVNKVTGSPTNFKGYFSSIFNTLKQTMGTTSSDILSSMSIDWAASLVSASPRSDSLSNVMSQLNYGVTNGFTSILEMLNGNFSSAATAALPDGATAGNYYVLGKITASELNNIVGTVKSFNDSQTIDKNKASANWSDIEDQLTDPYRPRQVIIYFDDRIYIGHFENFTWTRTSQNLLIYYDMKFVVTRMIICEKNKLNGTVVGSTSSSLGSLLTATAIESITNNLFSSKKSST